MKFKKIIFIGDDDYKIKCDYIHQELDNFLYLLADLQCSNPIYPSDEEDPYVTYLENELDKSELNIKTALGIK